MQDKGLINNYIQYVNHRLEFWKNEQVKHKQEVFSVSHQQSATEHRAYLRELKAKILLRLKSMF